MPWKEKRGTHFFFVSCLQTFVFGFLILTLLFCSLLLYRMMDMVSFSLNTYLLFCIRKIAHNEMVFVFCFFVFFLLRKICFTFLCQLLVSLKSLKCFINYLTNLLWPCTAHLDRKIIWLCVKQLTTILLVVCCLGVGLSKVVFKI